MAFPPATVGTGAYALALAKGLASKGVEVHVLAPECEGMEEFDMGLGLAITRMRVHSLVPMRYWESRAQLRRKVEEVEPDSVWTTNGMATRVAGLLGFWDRVRLFSCMRGSDVATRMPGKGVWARMESVPQRRAYRVSRAIAAASSYIKELAIEKGVAADKIFVSPPAFDFSSLEGYRFDPERLLAKYPQLQGCRIALTVARLTGQKQVHLALEATARLREAWPDLLHVIVGDGPERERIERLAGELGVEDRVLMVGSVRPMSEELFDLYSAAEVFLLLSRREGMGNVFVEAGAFGLPSIGAREGGVPEVVADGETGFLVGVKYPDEAAEMLDRLWGDDGLRIAMGSRARERVKREFGLEALAERSYGALVGSSHGA